MVKSVMASSTPLSVGTSVNAAAAGPSKTLAVELSLGNNCTTPVRLSFSVAHIPTQLPSRDARGVNQYRGAFAWSLNMTWGSPPLGSKGHDQNTPSLSTQQNAESWDVHLRTWRPFVLNFFTVFSVETLMMESCFSSGTVPIS